MGENKVYNKYGYQHLYIFTLFHAYENNKMTSKCVEVG
jgi:hypothetical protein